AQSGEGVDDRGQHVLQRGQILNRSRQDDGLLSFIETEDGVVTLVDRTVVFVAQTQVQGEPGVHSEVVLEIGVPLLNMRTVPGAVESRLISAQAQEEVSGRMSRKRGGAVGRSGGGVVEAGWGDVVEVDFALGNLLVIQSLQRLVADANAKLELM